MLLQLAVQALHRSELPQYASLGRLSLMVCHEQRHAGYACLHLSCSPCRRQLHAE